MPEGGGEEAHSGPPPAFVAYRFEATDEALDAEALLSGMGVDARPIPAPPGRVGGCGIALRIPVGQVELAETLLERAGLGWSDRVDADDL